MPTPLIRYEERTFGNLPSVRSYVRSQVGWKGGDHHKPMEYEGYVAVSGGLQRNTVNGAFTGIDAPNATSRHEFFSSGGVTPWSRVAYNKAYAKFREKALGEQSQLGVFFAEWEQSLDLIGSATYRLARLAKSLRARNLKKFWRDAKKFGKRYGRKGRLLPNHRKSLPELGKGLPKDVADGWLEFWFGWSASAGDIHNACKVLSGPLPFGPASGSSGASKTRRIWIYDTEHFYRSRIMYKVGGDVYLTNPNLFLANQLGLLNPAAILFELTPFSFLADWAFDLQSFIESFTDFIGVRIENPYTSKFCRYHDSRQIFQPYMTGGPSVAKGACVLRQLGIPRPIPNLDVCGNLGQSITRAASAAALLTQTLSGLSKR